MFLEGLVTGSLATGSIFLLLVAIFRRAGYSRTTGGTSFWIRGELVQVSGPYMAQVMRFMKNHEFNALNALTDQGRMEEAQALFNAVFERWLATPEGQHWAADYAPFLLKDE